jgi:hypothetical protein
MGAIPPAVLPRLSEGNSATCLTFDPSEKVYRPSIPFSARRQGWICRVLHDMHSVRQQTEGSAVRWMVTWFRLCQRIGPSNDAALVHAAELVLWIGSSDSKSLESVLFRTMRSCFAQPQHRVERIRVIDDGIQSFAEYVHIRSIVLPLRHHSIPLCCHQPIAPPSMLRSNLLSYSWVGLLGRSNEFSRIMC